MLTLSPLLMEKYLSAAENVSRLALQGPDSKPLLMRHQPPNRRRLEKRAEAPKTPAFYSLTDYDRTGLSQPSAIHKSYLFPSEGDYTFRILVGGARPPRSAPVKLALWIDSKVVHTEDVLEIGQDGTTFELTTKVAGGEHWIAASFLDQFDGLPPSFGGPNPAKDSPATKESRTPTTAGGGATQNQQLLVASLTAKGTAKGPADYLFAADSITVKWFEVIGPFHAVAGPAPESKRKILVCGHLDGHHQPACARTIIANLARRAFRRPVPPQELEPYLRLAANARQKGRSFEDSVGLALKALLVSPDFLFRIERDDAAGTRAHPLDPYELASRLSYFVWSSMPDDELLASAARGGLRKPEILEQQVRRLLKDPRFAGLVENFTGQWLETRRLESVNPDRERFPDFEDYLRDSMRREPEELFRYMVSHDRSILDFLDAGYTFLNERLARHYGIPGVAGPEFRKVDLTGATRGGLLTQAGVLTVSSYGNRTSPVLRGKWILENIAEIATAPASSRRPTAGRGGRRDDRVAARPARTASKQCGLRFLPRQDGSPRLCPGELRRSRAWRSQDGKFPVDASGTLPNGKSFQSAAELKTILKSDPDAFARGLTEKVLTYALRKGTRAIRPAGRKKHRRTLAQRVPILDYCFLEIVKSLPFQMRRGDRGKDDHHA